MAFQLPNRRAPLSARAEPRNPRTTAGDLFKTGQLCQPLLERVNHGRDQVAFDYLARETSLEVLNDCIRRIPDQQLTDFLIEHLLMTASLLSSEAFTGVDKIREELKELSLGVSAGPEAGARALRPSGRKARAVLFRPREAAPPTRRVDGQLPAHGKRGAASRTLWPARTGSRGRRSFHAAGALTLGAPLRPVET